MRIKWDDTYKARRHNECGEAPGMAAGTGPATVVVMGSGENVKGDH